MKFAIVNGIKQEALKSGERGTCICCGSETVAHCGNFNVHHWKHKSLQECDTWYEPETEWHRNWKNQFPVEFQEIVQKDSMTGEKHIADILHPSKKITIEFQHSSISTDEIQSREVFYKNLVWVLDCCNKSEKFSFYYNLKTIYENQIWPEWAKSANKKLSKMNEKNSPERLIQLELNRKDGLILEEQRKELQDLSKKPNYSIIQWKNKPKVWSDAKCPIFLDLGGELIYRIVKPVVFWDGFLVKEYSKTFFINRFVDVSSHLS